MYRKILVPVDGSQASDGRAHGSDQACQESGQSDSVDSRRQRVHSGLWLRPVCTRANPSRCCAKRVENILDAAEEPAQREGVKTNWVLLEAVGGPGGRHDSGAGESVVAGLHRHGHPWTPRSGSAWSWEATPRRWCVAATVPVLLVHGAAKARGDAAARARPPRRKVADGLQALITALELQPAPDGRQGVVSRLRIRRIDEERVRSLRIIKGSATCGCWARIAASASEGSARRCASLLQTPNHGDRGRPGRRG